WDGTTWTQQFPANSPPFRQGASMVYDAATQSVILFGGKYSAGYLNDTWAWDGTKWNQLRPSASPPSRWDASMAYDAVHQQVVLFGGYGAPCGPNSCSKRNDTWVWNNGTWRLQHPALSPSPRYGATFDYDPSIHAAILVGGFTATNQVLSDTWTWDGTAWTQLSPASSPSPRGDGSMAYDGATQSIVLYGGWECCMAAGDDTWVLK